MRSRNTNARGPSASPCRGSARLRWCSHAARRDRPRAAHGLGSGALPSVLSRAVPALRDALPIRSGRQRHESGSYFIGGKTGLAIRAAKPQHADARYHQYKPDLHHLCFRARSREDIDRFHAFFVAELAPLGGKLVERFRKLNGIRDARNGPDEQWKAAAFARWHEPDESRGSRPESVRGSG